MKHRRERQKQWKQRQYQDESKREDKRFYDSALWKNVRASVLQEEPYCRECAREGRVTLATMVDHIIPVQQGGRKTHSENLQPMCDLCHARKRWKESQGYTPMPVHIVCGPPGSGKSTWVKQRASIDDLVVDLDLIGTALTVRGYEQRDIHERPSSHISYALVARNSLLKELATKRNITAWIIVMAPTPQERLELRERFNADVTVLEVSAVECLRRIAKDTARAYQVEGIRPVIERWWDEYEPSGADNRVRETMTMQTLHTGARSVVDAVQNNDS